MLSTQVRLFNAWLTMRDALIDRNRRLRGDNGEVSSTVIIIAILCTLAIAVGAIIVQKVTKKATDIPTQ
jgi:hypothetical protein